MAVHMSRPGDGVGIEVVHQTIPQPNGTTLRTAGLNLSTAPVPDRRYAADLATVLYKHEVLRLVFAQETISSISPTLRSMLIVNMAPGAARNFLRSLQQLSPTLDELAEKNGIEPGPLFNVESEPGQTIALAANLAAVAIIGRDACIDFFQASPFAMAKIGSARMIPVDPVVRVDVRTSLLLSLRNAIQKLEGNFPPEIVEVLQE